MDAVLLPWRPLKFTLETKVNSEFVLKKGVFHAHRVSSSLCRRGLLLQPSGHSASDGTKLLTSLTVPDPLNNIAQKHGNSTRYGTMSLTFEIRWASVSDLTVVLMECDHVG